MGQGASKTTSSSIYTDKINKTVCNDKFEKKKEKEGVNHNEGYYRKYLRDSSDYLRLTRNPETIKGESTGVRFHSLVKRYEENNNICLRQISKEELVFKLKEYIETTNSILRIKDDSRQFLSYKFEYDDIIRLYLYKAFYPSVFDYDIVQANGNENIVFKSSYIKENIGVIQQQIEILLWTISYDAIAIAISNQAYEQISSSKRYNATIRCDITANEIKEDIEVEVKTPRKKIPSIKLIKFFVPSIVYGAKYHSRLYKNKDTNKEKPEKKIVSIFTKFSNIYGIKSDAINTALKKRDVLADAYNDCKTVINSADKFTRILNMYYINSWSHLFDLNIMQTNRDFKPYMIDGIVTKYHINDMIEDNSKKINDTVSASESNFNLKSIYNNPNCIIENFSLRDYEIIDFLITRSAKTISSYYFANENDEPVTPANISEKIEYLNEEDNLDIVNKKIPIVDIDSIDKVNFEKIYDYIHPLQL